MTRRPPRATRTDTLFPYTPRFRSPWGLIKRVYLPAVMPELITGAQLAFGNAWRALISAEMLIGFGKGLGRSLAYSGEIADMTGVMANILVIAKNGRASCRERVCQYV